MTRSSLIKALLVMLCLFVVASQLRQKEEKKELTQAEKNALEGQAILNDPSAINTHPDS